MNIERLNIRDIQKRKLKEEVGVGRIWYTSKAVELIAEALSYRGNSDILVVGCGVRADDAIAYAWLLDANVVGIDINEVVIKKAKRLYARVGEDLKRNPLSRNRKIPRFEIVDFTNSSAVACFKEKRFDLVTFIGVLTNIITDREAIQALNNSAELLKPEGKVVISDFELQQGNEYWCWRYSRDKQALESLGINGEDLFGTIVVRPKGLHGEEADKLDWQEVRGCLLSGEFERLARHRSIGKFSDFLHEAGFKPKRIIRSQARDVAPEEDRVYPREILSNIQLLAQRV